MEDLTAKAEAAEAETKGDALTEFAVNLNVLAQEGRIDPLVGRGAAVERTIQALCRRRKNNPPYIGEAGVGKTALAAGLSRRTVEAVVPAVLTESTAYGRLGKDCGSPCSYSWPPDTYQ